ncbi:hypothetical protein IT415_02260 [bacterium]|nr:hypothetical protein [bacterium]
MAKGFTRRCGAPRPSTPRTPVLERSDWLVEICSTGEVLIVTDRTYIEMSTELNQTHPGDWDLWDRE